MLKDLPKFVVSILFCELIGLSATPFTIGAINTWYNTIEKPWFTPPNWVFSPVWTVLYMFLGISFFLIWTQGWKKRQNRIAGIFFLLQLLFNFFWAFLFFGLRSPLLALIDILLLWIFSIITIWKFVKISRTAAAFLLPYIVWVSFAAILNLSIVLLN